MNPILEVRNVSYIYSVGTPFEHKALDQVSFTLNRGEFVGIIGHTGSGKSTLMQHLNGLLKPTSGDIVLDGKSIWVDKASTRQARFRVGLVFQYPEYQLFEETVAIPNSGAALPRPYCCSASARCPYSGLSKAR